MHSFVNKSGEKYKKVNNNLPILKESNIKKKKI